MAGDHIPFWQSILFLKTSQNLPILAEMKVLLVSRKWLFISTLYKFSLFAFYWDNFKSERQLTEINSLKIKSEQERFLGAELFTTKKQIARQ